MDKLIESINNLAKPTSFDWSMLGVTRLSLVVSAIAILITYTLYRKQIEISNEQTKISSRQTDIMEQQNKIALFEKRLYILNEIELIYSFYLDMNMTVKILNIPTVGKETMISACDKSLKYNNDIKAFNIQGGEEQYPLLYRYTQSLKRKSYEIELLFDGISCEKLIEAYIDVMLDVYDREENINKKIIKFVNVGQVFFEDDFENMKSQIKL